MTNRTSIALMVCLLVLTGAGLAGAAGHKDTLVGCYSKRTGDVQMVRMSGLPSRCPRGWVRFTWSAEGPRGATGPQGPTGPIGATGPQGFQGDPGPMGAQGLQGPIGPTGPAGGSGASGATGPEGPTGPMGPQGFQGDPGLMGPAGPPGSPGVSALELLSASSAVDSTGRKTVTATCPVGKSSIAGGAEILAGTATAAQLQDVAIGVSKPTAALDGWTSTAWETDSVTPTWSVTVHVLCAFVA